MDQDIISTSGLIRKIVQRRDMSPQKSKTLGSKLEEVLRSGNRRVGMERLQLQGDNK
jgi:hypothetical protein